MHRFFIFYFLLFISAISFANTFKAGITGGFTFSQIDGDNLSGYNKPGIAGGLFVNRNISSNKINCQLEIKYAQKGASAKFATEDQKVTLHYIEFPFTARYLYKQKYLLEGGLYPAYLIEQKGTLNAYNKIDFGFIAGINYLFTNNFYANLRYSYTLFRIYKIPDIQNFGIWYRTGYYNNVVNLGLGYQF